MIKKILLAVAAMATLGAGGMALDVYAADPPADPPAINPTTQVEAGIKAAGGGGTGAVNLPTLITNIIKILLFVIGAVAVIMIIVGGIRYVISSGDQNQVKAAKDTIFYAIIGLVVAILSYAIVDFVVDSIITTTPTPPSGASLWHDESVIG